MGVLRSERKKYEEIAEYNDIDLCVITPQCWNFNYKHHEFEENTNEENYTIFPIRVAFAGYHHRSFYFSSFRKILKSFQPDIIHIFQEPHSIFTLQVLLARNIFLPKAKVVFITWENLIHQKYPFRFSNIYKYIENYSYRHANYATPITVSADNVLRARGFLKGTHVLRWGIDFELIKKQDANDIRKKLGLLGSFVVGYVGRFVIEKGILDLVKAVGQLPANVKLLLIGDGPLKNEIKSLAEQISFANRLITVDSISNTEISKYLNCLDTLVLPSHESKYWVEQLGKVLLEAMACEIPVIGSNTGEIPFVIENSGLIFQAGNINELSDKIEAVRLKSIDVSKLVKVAKQRVENLYSWRTIAANLHKIYGEIINIHE